MSTSSKRRTAEQLFRTGFTLFQERRFEQALTELQRAEDAFRKLDARGHPFDNALSNGVSGLANTLVLSGRCHQKLGNFEQAITCYETSLINGKFEKAKPFHAFVTILQGDLAACYEKELPKIDEQALQNILTQDIKIDSSFRFPFSLTRKTMSLARLYELVPERYPRFREFYQRAKEQDAAIRHSARSSDELTIKRMTFYVWGILLLIWVVYGFIMVEALIRGK